MADGVPLKGNNGAARRHERNTPVVALVDGDKVPDLGLDIGQVRRSRVVLEKLRFRKADEIAQ